MALVVFAVQFDPLRDWRPVLGFASLGLSLVAVGGYAFRNAHTLWGRFDFESTLTWVEMEGSFIRSKNRSTRATACKTVFLLLACHQR